MVNQVQEVIDEDPSRSMRKIPGDLEVSKHLIRIIVKQDIRFKSYSLRRGQMLMEETKQRRSERVKLLLFKLKKPPVPWLKEVSAS